MSTNHIKGQKKVLILGLGLNEGGVGATRFFANQGSEVLVTDIKKVEDLKPSLNQLKKFKNIKYVLGKHRFSDIDWADLIIRNPAIKPDNPYLKYARKLGKKVETDMGIFLQFINPKQIIGITGTKGKSTTATLIYQVLKSAGVKLAHTRGLPAGQAGVMFVFAGNIGKSVLDTLSLITPKTLVVLELSSFQLEAFEQHKTAPKWAVITNIFPDHLNYYKNFDDYIKAKKLIAKYQTKDDFLFLNQDLGFFQNRNFIRNLDSTIFYFSKKDLPKNFQPILLGNHNRDNFAAALKVSGVFGIPQKKALSVMATFTGIPYRLQKIYDKAGIKIYNDSAATNPDATIQALKSLFHPPDRQAGPGGGTILIAGGVNKNLDYKNLAKVINKYAKKVFFLEGSATDEIISKFEIRSAESSLKNISNFGGIYNNLEEILKDIQKNITKGDIILFSPGAASFNLFRNEFDRGEKFNRAVEKIFGN